MADSMNTYPDILEYQVKEKSIYFHCPGLCEEDCVNKTKNTIGELFNAFLFGLSENRKVFFHGYRFFGEETKVVNPDIILEKAEIFLNPSHVFLELQSAKISSLDFYRACEADIYYFDNHVKWTDFLVSSPIKHPIELVEKGILSALFSYGEFGGEFYFVCNKTYESKVLQLFADLSALGYKVKNCSHISSIWG